MLDESICLFMGVGLFVSFILLLMKSHVSKHVDPDQTPHDVASDLSLHCLSMTL